MKFLLLATLVAFANASCSCDIEESLEGEGTVAVTYATADECRYSTVAVEGVECTWTAAVAAAPAADATCTGHDDCTSLTADEATCTAEVLVEAVAAAPCAWSAAVSAAAATCLTPDAEACVVDGELTAESCAAVTAVEAVAEVEAVAAVDAVDQVLCAWTAAVSEAAATCLGGDECTNTDSEELCTGQSVDAVAAVAAAPAVTCEFTAADGDAAATCLGGDQCDDISSEEACTNQSTAEVEEVVEVVAVTCEYTPAVSAAAATCTDPREGGAGVCEPAELNEGACIAIELVEAVEAVAEVAAVAAADAIPCAYTAAVEEAPAACNGDGANCTLEVLTEENCNNASIAEVVEETCAWNAATPEVAEAAAACSCEGAAEDESACTDLGTAAVAAVTRTITEDGDACVWTEDDSSPSTTLAAGVALAAGAVAAILL